MGGTAGPVVVLLNALGQGLQFWHRLTSELIETNRVIIWEPRGTISPRPPFGLVDQVNDLDAVLQYENIQSCHLVGWCTGPKVAIDFYLKRPEAVRSMAFLNGAFKCDAGPEEFSSPYLQNLEFLLRRLVHKPAMAASMMKTFQSPPQESETEILEGEDAEEISVKVLSMVNRHLKSAVLAPYQSEETTVNYAHQLADFWSSDVRPKAPQVRVPVLFMSAEYDGIVSPAGSQMAARLFPDARHVHVAAATHYCLYDRADFVAVLLKQFFENPNAMQAVEHAKEEVAMES
jgi:pimeloyl-ACP methyl ester carboxylesterase